MKTRLVLLLAAFYTMFIAAASAQTSTYVTYHYSAINYPGAIAQETNANGINNSNVIVGSYVDPQTSVGHAFEYVNGKFTSFDFPGATSTIALGISDTGDVVGEYALSNGSNYHGFLRHNGSFTTIDYPGASSTALVGINKAGTIVGIYDGTYGFIYQNGTFTPYNAPTRKGEPNYFSALTGINNAGAVVGWEQSGDYQAGFWAIGNDTDFLKPVSYFRNNTVTGINTGDDIVGCLNSGAYVAFAVESGEGSESAENFPSLETLSSKSPLVYCPTGINNARVIVGNPGFVAVPVLTLNVTSPANHSTDTNPVHVAANASGVNPISQIQVWANGSEVYHVNGGTLNANLNLPTGSNEKLKILAVDTKGVRAAVTQIITVN